MACAFSRLRGHALDAVTWLLLQLLHFTVTVYATADAAGGVALMAHLGCDPESLAPEATDRVRGVWSHCEGP